MNVTQTLTGQVALVTGAASGIGRATAVSLLAHGAHVEGVDSDADRLQTLGAECVGRPFCGRPFDLADSAGIAGLVERILADCQRIDMLINVAGIPGEMSLASPVLGYREADWDRVFAIDLKAPFLLTKYVGRHMVDRGGGGRIVHVSSSSAFRALHVNNAAYPAAKAGLSALARISAGELGPHDINVNVVAPGLTDTPLSGVGGRSAEQLAQASREGPMANLLHRYSRPEDVANVIVFLCLPGSRQITGQTLHTSAGAIV